VASLAGQVTVSAVKLSMRVPSPLSSTTSTEVALVVLGLVIASVRSIVPSFSSALEVAEVKDTEVVEEFNSSHVSCTSSIPVDGRLPEPADDVRVTMRIHTGPARSSSAEPKSTVTVVLENVL